jgi:hypothetical protein
MLFASLRSAPQPHCPRTTRPSLFCVLVGRRRKTDARGETAGGAQCGSLIICFVVKSAKAGLREQEVGRTGMPRAERRLVVQAKRSGEQLLASN